MKTSENREFEQASNDLRSYGQNTVHGLIVALLVWLFGVLVFIPLAESLSWQIKTFVSLFFLLAFSFLISRILPGAKKLIDALAYFPARKYGVSKGLSQENASTLFRYLLYTICSLILYGLYSPFLIGIHPAVSGIVLILVLILIFFLLMRIFSIAFPKFFGWLAKS
ncbi:MAG: hypothetical protein ACLFU9_02700 [Candidatus Bathyarchaeia archaeon]